jgi:hypothetical protein
VAVISRLAGLRGPGALESSLGSGLGFMTTWPGGEGFNHWFSVCDQKGSKLQRNLIGMSVGICP